MSENDLRLLDKLIGQALLDDQIHDALIESESRTKVLGSVPLSLGAARYLGSLASAPDLHTFARWILADFDGYRPN